ncbi:MAG: hypothetical protein B6244_02665 [Candidatus Cloacimonetes bacterium 4572_55]|nr:MAG: hypothetical protein B6244_02665 [Candidatus Cloacimonetes bacterium 4572_55]
MKIRAIAINTFREAARDKILYTLLIFGLLLIVASEVVSPLTLGQQERVMKDIGLASISIFCVLIILLVGAGLLYKELDKRTIYTILSKPVHRYQFILGKYFGLLTTLLVIVAVMTVTLYAHLWLMGQNPTAGLLIAICFIYIKLAVVTSVAIMFSGFSSPALSATFTFIIYFIGHLSADIKNLTQHLDSQFVHFLTNALYYLVPNLDYFDLKSQAVHQIPIDSSFYFLSTIYAITYIFAMLLIAIMVFERRDLK